MIMSRPKIEIVKKKEIPIKSSILKNQHKVVKMILDGYNLRVNDKSKKSQSASLIEGISGNPDKKITQNLLLHMSKNNINVLDNPEFITVSELISNSKNRWFKDPFTWNSKSYNSDRNVSDFIHYVFCKYETPKFFDSSFFKNKIKEIDIFFWLGEGKSLKKYPCLPIPMTNKMIYHFIKAPKHLTVEEAFLWSFVMGLDGNGLLFNSLMENNKINTFDRFKTNINLWTDVITFLSRQGMMNYNQVSPLIDYIWFVIHEENPYFTTKGRTLAALLKSSDDWHEKIAKTKHHINGYWEGFNIPNYSLTVGKDEHKKTYSITQIKYGKELVKEGRELSHCVSSYTRDCSNGNCSIWSLKDDSTQKRLVTIELSKDYRINQIRGFGNRKATDHEMSFITDWAQKNNLSFGRWI